MVFQIPSFDEWFGTLSPAEQERTRSLVSALRNAGADDPESWARSEISENIAQFARFAFLNSIWVDSIDRWSDRADEWVGDQLRFAQSRPAGAFSDAGRALQRALDRGVTSEDLGRISRAVAYQVVFDLLMHLDEGFSRRLGPPAPGWRLIETDSDGEPTGREIGGLHESILSMDPSGREGSPNPTSGA